MTCPRCNGLGLIQKTINVPAHIYGEPVELTADEPCPKCGGTGKIKAVFNGDLKQIGEGENYTYENPDFTTD